MAGVERVVGGGGVGSGGSGGGESCSGNCGGNVRVESWR